jgi:hypothetical protein
MWKTRGIAARACRLEHQGPTSHEVGMQNASACWSTWIILLVFPPNWFTLIRPQPFFPRPFTRCGAGRILDGSNRSCEWRASKKERP